MAPSKTEQVLEALKVRLGAVPSVAVERNTVVPETVPVGGLIVLRDGDAGEAEQALGGFANSYYSHRVEIEVYVSEGDAAFRDAAFDALLQEIGIVLEADPTLGGLAFGMTYGRPEPTVEPVSGAPAFKTGVIGLEIDYEAPSPLG